MYYGYLLEIQNISLFVSIALQKEKLFILNTILVFSASILI